MVEKEDQDSETGDIAGRGMGAPSTGSLEQPSFESEVMSKVNKKQALGNLLDYSVEVTGYVDHIGKDGQRYTTYEVLIAKKGKVQSGEEKCWTVSKRYSDFVALRDSLRGMYIEVDSFDFPNKSKFNTHATWTKERRKRGFNDYMDLLTTLPYCPVGVVQFLGIDDAGGGSGHAMQQQTPQQESSGSAATNITPVDASKTWLKPTFPPLSEATEEISHDKTLRSKAFKVWGSADRLLRDSCGPLVLAVMVVVVCVTVTVAAIWRISGTAGLVVLLGGQATKMIQEKPAKNKLARCPFTF